MQTMAAGRGERKEMLWLTCVGRLQAQRERQPLPDTVKSCVSRRAGLKVPGSREWIETQPDRTLKMGFQISLRQIQDVPGKSGFQLNMQCLRYISTGSDPSFMWTLS